MALPTPGPPGSWTSSLSPPPIATVVSSISPLPETATPLQSQGGAPRSAPIFSPHFPLPPSAHPSFNQPSIPLGGMLQLIDSTNFLPPYNLLTSSLPSLAICSYLCSRVRPAPPLGPQTPSPLTFSTNSFLPSSNHRLPLSTGSVPSAYKHTISPCHLKKTTKTGPHLLLQLMMHHSSALLYSKTPQNTFWFSLQFSSSRSFFNPIPNRRPPHHPPPLLSARWPVVSRLLHAGADDPSPWSLTCQEMLTPPPQGN